MSPVSLAISTVAAELTVFRHSRLSRPLLKSSTAPRRRRATRAPEAASSASAGPGRARYAPAAAVSSSSSSRMNMMDGTQEGTALCTSVVAPTVQGQLAEMAEAVAGGANLIEIRLDKLSEFYPERDLSTLIDNCPAPCVVTFRPDWEGGDYCGPEAERLAALKLAALRGADFVDVELKAREREVYGKGSHPSTRHSSPSTCSAFPLSSTLPSPSPYPPQVAPIFFGAGGDVPDTTAVIVSSHNYESTPPDVELDAAVAAAWEAGADIVKIATTAQSFADARRVLGLLERRKGPTVALAMGEHGVVSRVLAGKYGGFLTFGALDAARQSAPGQPTCAELRGRYRLAAQTSDTRVFGVLGDPVAQSKGPQLHNAAFAAVDPPVDAVYLPLLVNGPSADRPGGDFRGFFESIESDPTFAGFSVTIPHKEEALLLCQDEKGVGGGADPVAASIGAVNTLVRDDRGKWRGSNTDWAAAVGAVEMAATSRGWEGLTGRAAVVLGAGGAARGLVFGLVERGCSRVIVVNRTAKRAEALAREADVSGKKVIAATYAQLEANGGLGALLDGAAPVDAVLCNTTSVGMTGGPGNGDADSPVSAAVAGSFGVVFDAVYNPRVTRLLREGAAGGATQASGLDMFVGQAAAQWRLFAGREDAPVGLMRQTVIDSLQ